MLVEYNLLVGLMALILTVTAIAVRTKLIAVAVIAGVFWYLFAYASAETLFIGFTDTGVATKIVQTGDPGTAGQNAMIWASTLAGLVLHLYSLAYVIVGGRFGENV